MEYKISLLIELVTQPPHVSTTGPPVIKLEQVSSLGTRCHQQGEGWSWDAVYRVGLSPDPI